jgi:lipopolysaccharide cholinephosphotransferase
MMPECHQLTQSEQRSLHQALLKLLIEFDRVCHHEGIPYQLGAGTLLGAVRHRGFVPWDDDIDVCLLRSDYERFLKIASSLLSPGFLLQHQGVEPKYPLLFAKMMLSDTEFITPEYQTLGIHQGIYIDIFPFDEVRPHQVLGKIHFGMTHYVSIARVILLAGRSRELGINRTPVLRKGIQCCHLLLRCLGQKRFDRLTIWLATIYSREPATSCCYTPAYVTCLVSGGLSRTRQLRRVRSIKAFTHTIYAEFCGYQFPIPSNYDEVLTKLYGDYRQLPPLEQRRPTHKIVKFSVNNQA